MIKNVYLEKFKTQKKKLTEFERVSLSHDDNYIMNLERPISLKEINKMPYNKLEIFIDDIMCNKKVNTLLYSNNYKKQLDLYQKQKKAFGKNIKLEDNNYNTNKKIAECESLFLKKKKIKMLGEIKNTLSNFKLTKSLSTNKIKKKTKGFYKCQQNTEKMNNKLFFKPVNEIRFNGYQRSFKNCLERSKSNSEFSLPDIDLNINDVYSRLYHNMIFSPIKLKKLIIKKTKKQKLTKVDNNLNEINNGGDNEKNKENEDLEDFLKKNKKLKIRNIFREYLGKEFLLVSSFFTRHKCWKENSGGPKVRRNNPGKLNLNKFKRKNLKEKLYFSCGNSKIEQSEDDIIDVNDYRDNDLNSNLHLAVKDNNEEFVKYFLNKNFSPNEQNNFGDTPLHFAMQLKNKQIIKLLINDGGNAWIKNNKGISPYDLADKEIRIDFNLGNVYS